jgi:Fe-S-cluster-containing dehydrogenase component
MSRAREPKLITTRREALRLLAAQMALIVAGCSKPSEEIVPYVRMPERLVPGVPLQFATTLPLGGYGRGVLCTSIEGRPIKAEGNPLHPASLGATDVFAEAAVLSLYDPDRSQTVTHAGEISNWETFAAALLPRLDALTARDGQGLRLLTGLISSPTALRQIRLLRQRYPKLVWHLHDPLANAAAREGSKLAFGRPLTALPRFAEADVVVTLDADPLGPGPSQIANARGFAERRRIRRGSASMSRLYAVEIAPTLTSANADHRLARSPSEIVAFAIAMAREMGADLAEPQMSPGDRRFAQAAARDLSDHPGRAMVLAGTSLSADIQALCHWINDHLGAPIDLVEAPVDTSPGAPLADLVRDLDQGEVDSVIIAGCNPGYDAPSEFAFSKAIAKAQFRVHLGLYADETSALCDWHIPESHALESWSDLAAPNGAASPVQPLIQPLFDSRTLHHILAAWLGQFDASPYDLVRQTWKAKAADGDFESWWREALTDGVMPGGAPASVAGLTATLPKVAPPSKPPSLSLAVRPDPCLYDGAFANNAWLQELPKPLTKEVWGNSIGISPNDARELGVADGEMIRLAANGRSLEAPVRIQPGHAKGVLSLTLGYGRTRAGRIGTGIGADAYVLRSAEAPWIIEAIEATRIGERRPTPSTQHQFTLDGEARELLPSYPIEQWRALPPTSNGLPRPSFLPTPSQAGTRWGMVIDTSLCIGCNACVMACQVENNSPVVGPDEIAAGRDMHWLRIDAYDLGSVEKPDIGFQPVPCMHCETAPCEPVCPVEASVHDSEGLNVQVYNRCVGTRFCEANCPYKVRRFNFFGYADGQEYGDLGAEILRAHNNPDVTVRGRGVMEKCTYCVQRISRARRTADRENRPIGDGEVVTACQAACPTRAITFGDLAATGAAVAALNQEPHRYELLGHLNTRPRTSYLARVGNPNPSLAGEND